MSSRDKEAEKMRLWNEVMGKDRVRRRREEPVVLETGEEDAGSASRTLKNADDAMTELNAILEKQKKDLEEMRKKAEQPQTFAGVNAELTDLQKEIRRDYSGIREEHAEEEKETDSRAVFEKVDRDLAAAIVGQDEGIRALSSALRRPFVMGREKGRADNIILIMGPEGSGRHASVSAAARSLYEQHVFLSDEVCTIDLSRYQSASQEQIFLQDLYQALQGKGGIVCFENFEQGFPSFLRMISSLVTEGSVLLPRRYVLSRGILVENQTGLVKDSIDSLHAGGKYLIFITDGKISNVQNAFGASFMYHVLDTVVFERLDENAASGIIARQSGQLIRRCREKMKVDLTYDDAVSQWVLRHYDRTHGADAIIAYYRDFYISLSEVIMKHETDRFSLTVRDDVPTAVYEGGTAVVLRQKNSAEEIAEVRAELDRIVGLNEVKKYIGELQAHMQIQQRRREQGMKTAEVSRHMIFTGNPGTGKTTVARLISRYMKAIGALSQGQLVEVTRADLVAQYVGQTAPLTMSVIRSAIGGVLFIDEAYSLYRGKDDSFGLEAIDTLVKAMEDNRSDLIVILAGYSREMKAFLEANSGLKSRFPNMIEFPDYTAEELLQIASLQAAAKGYRIAEEAHGTLLSYFDHRQKTDAAEAGNGRLARNVVEDAILHQAARLLEDPQAPLDELRKEDFSLCSAD